MIANFSFYFYFSIIVTQPTDNSWMEFFICLSIVVFFSFFIADVRLLRWPFVSWAKGSGGTLGTDPVRRATCAGRHRGNGVGMG